MNLKSLLKDTAIYGMSSIVGRFLNYLLVVLYTYVIPAESGDYGIVSNLYAYAALFLALLTFGMETTFFRFANKQGQDDKLVYSTALRLVGGVGLGFLVIVFAFLGPISGGMGYAEHPEYVGCFAVITAMDAFQAIAFSRLRQMHRPVRFMLLKFAFIIPSILLNVFIFLVMGKNPAMQELYHRFNDGVGLIFFANLICTSLVMLLMIPEIKGIFYGFDRDLARQMRSYSWPILILSLLGVLNQVADKILLPYLIPGEEGMVQLGIYSSCGKIAMIMALLTQAFRYAYEPIVFGDNKGNKDVRTLADGMKYFVIASLLAFLAVMFYLPLIKHLIGPSYWSGLGVVPVVMMAEIFMGIYFNLSFWYKLTDQTWWGAIISGIGAAVMIAVNLIFVPKYGYWACAWGGFAGYGTAMLLSLVIGNRKYPVPYDYNTMGLYTILALALYACSRVPEHLGLNLSLGTELAANTCLLAVYCLTVMKRFRNKSNKTILK